MILFRAASEIRSHARFRLAEMWWQEMSGETQRELQREKQTKQKNDRGGKQAKNGQQQGRYKQDMVTDLTARSDKEI